MGAVIGRRKGIVMITVAARLIQFAALASVALVAAAWTTASPSPATFNTPGSSGEDAARERLAAIYARHPHDPFVELALAESYETAGRLDLAEPFYRSVMMDGKGIVPPTLASPSDAGKTLDQIACTDLRAMSKNPGAC